MAPGEARDDGDDDNTDACLSTCVVASCGDGFVQAGVEECDPAAAGPACKDDCTLHVCGDEVALAGVEACDDGTSNTDDCLTSCVVASCGDGFVQGSEECDDGNVSNADACKNDCSLNVCGDNPACRRRFLDDGNQVSTDGCTASCVPASCGDGFVFDGVEDATIQTRTSAARAALTCCGDGVVQAGEACDDGNTISGDWCSATCQAECLWVTRKRSPRTVRDVVRRGGELRRRGRCP